MHGSDRRTLAIMVGGFLLIGGTYLLFKVFGDSHLIAILAIGGWLVLMGSIARYFRLWEKKE